MEKLINAEILIEKLEWVRKYGSFSMKKSIPTIVEMVDEMPDGRERGHWIENPCNYEDVYDFKWSYKECSVCHENSVKEHLYCPFCGSKMYKEI